MKTVYTTDEGVKMNSNLDFGSTTDILNEFDYLMDTTETMWDIQCRYSYRITDDHYIQLAHAYNDDILDLKIIAQYKLRYENLKENILFIIKNNIEAHLFFNGFPKLENSAIFTPAEFDEIITIKKVPS